MIIQTIRLDPSGADQIDASTSLRIWRLGVRIPRGAHKAPGQRVDRLMQPGQGAIEQLDDGGRHASNA
jgi:hypothetical protein